MVLLDMEDMVQVMDHRTAQADMDPVTVDTAVWEDTAA